ncbi:MAG TPA: stage II sporulation protein M [Jiangellaceae bacterium]|nr:stage II sporulation protein M [Jiangellaceae bacterium]
MDLDAFVAAHQPEWDRLDALIRRRGKLTGVEADELVTLYRRASTHLSTIRSAAPDPATLAWLSRLVSRARTSVAGSSDPGWGEVLRFITEGFPAAVYRSRHWWVTVGLVFVAVWAALGWWVAGSPQVQASIGAPEEIRQLVEQDFEDYYSAHPAASFAAQVWTNNAWVAAGALIFGIAIIPVGAILWLNALNVGIAGGLMAAHGRADIFFGLITPHGLLELTAVFVAAGAGLRLGWAWIDPGRRPRTEVLAERGRAAVGMAIGLTGVLLISGLIEAFVTPSGLPTWARIAIGVVAWAAFIGYVWTYGRRAALAGDEGDLTMADRGDVVPAAG